MKLHSDEVPPEFNVISNKPGYVRDRHTGTIGEVVLVDHVAATVTVRWRGKQVLRKVSEKKVVSVPHRAVVGERQADAIAMDPDEPPMQKRILRRMLKRAYP